MCDLKMIWKICCVFVLCLVCDVELTGTDVGDICYQDGKIGTCQFLFKCMSAFNNPKREWWKYNRCGFVGDDPIICCVELPVTTPRPVATTPLPVATTPRMRTTTSEEYSEETYVLRDPTDGAAAERTGDACPPMKTDLSPPKTGRKAHDKCIEYQHQLIYPCEPSNALMGGMERGNHCHHNVEQLIVGGVDAAQNEFPHMVLLGYGRTNDTADWKCGGTLLSDRFILTAGHCTFWRGPVMYAIVGALRRSDDVKSSQVYRISRIIKHPSYRPPSKYHDIALLETATPITLDDTTVPACLDVFGGDKTVATATGWGITEFMGNVADTLQKVNLTQFSENECWSKFQRERHMDHYNSNTQMCYGDHSKPADTCQGDSGGPLTILNEKVHCMYTVVGVTSFGRGCGNIAIPGYYTRVSHYVPWIESVVWP